MYTLFSFYTFFLTLFSLCGLWDLSSWPGTEPSSSAVKARHPNQLDRQGIPLLICFWSLQKLNHTICTLLLWLLLLITIFVQCIHVIMRSRLLSFHIGIFTVCTYSPLYVYTTVYSFRLVLVWGHNEWCCRSGAQSKHFCEAYLSWVLGHAHIQFHFTTVFHFTFQQQGMRSPVVLRLHQHSSFQSFHF